VEHLTKEQIEAIDRSTINQKAGEKWTGRIAYDNTFVHVPLQLWPEQHISSMIRGIEFEHCPNCGGLLPEIEVFGRDGKIYFFTCTRIVDKDQKTVIAETDYERLRLLNARRAEEVCPPQKSGLNRASFSTFANETILELPILVFTIKIWLKKYFL
jgi:hypothetical protein